MRLALILASLLLTGLVIAPNASAASTVEDMACFTGTVVDSIVCIDFAFQDGTVCNYTDLFSTPIYIGINMEQCVGDGDCATGSWAVDDFVCVTNSSTGPCLATQIGFPTVTINPAKCIGTREL